MTQSIDDKGDESNSVVQY